MSAINKTETSQEKSELSSDDLTSSEPCGNCRIRILNSYKICGKCSKYYCEQCYEDYFSSPKTDKICNDCIIEQNQKNPDAIDLNLVLTDRNSMDKVVFEYMENKRTIKDLEQRQGDILKYIHLIRLSHPIYSVNRCLRGDPEFPQQCMGLFTKLRRANKCKDSLVEDIENFTYKIVEYPRDHVISDATFSMINK